MKSRRSRLLSVLIALAVVLPLVACGTTAVPTTVPSTAAQTAAPTAAVSTSAPTQLPPTAVPPTPTAGPTKGGKVVVGEAAEPTTLDPALSQMSATYEIMALVSDALISRDPFTGKFVPWLAESWTFSPDGLTGTFKLRKDVKWHDGSAFTAKDYEYTFNRALDPATKSSGTGPAISAMKDAKAVDDYTLEIHMNTPFFPILVTLATAGMTAPLPKDWIEKNGADKFGRSPIGEGMYKFASWKTGESIVIQRNPDYKWAPAWVTGPYIDTIEFRYIGDDSTIMAGLEAGEIDYAGIQSYSVARFKQNPKIALHGMVAGGNSLFVQFNQSLPLFQDLNVKKALALSVDRKPIVAGVFDGYATESYGPISPATSGYDSEQEGYGYKTDLAGAKAALQAAGYTFDAGGMAVKDGKPLKFSLNVASGFDRFLKLAQILQVQWKAIGVQVEIKQLEPAANIADISTGKYEATTLGFGYPDFDIIPVLYLSTANGGAGMMQVSDPKWDELLLATRSTLDPAKRQEAVNAAAKFMIQNVYIISFASQQSFVGVSTRVKGYIFSDVTGDASIYNTYVVK